MKLKEKNVVFEGNWTKTFKTKWKNNDKTGNWEYIGRKNNQKGVIVIPRLKKNNKIYYILIKQFRVPLEDYVIEFPAGLVDNNESVKECALRELKEETGAEGDISNVTPALSTSSGITNEIIHYVFVDVSCIKESNPDNSESIEVLKIEKNEINNYLCNVESLIDCKVWLFFTK
ncbi:MAG: NUDIX hydrolase [Candidatus Mcinerneyibacterium aminivorans]|uniref:NUDIX hydrolase n=1 Tax=Candidatus Mcinerneyibacterium aminivorans TaxID=2703815 RepID=A0A5D0MA46_9BACT|nr:MAG: NUDIX hydrolase [Candidatus Mcinerneyibacterium aminivorans]